MHKQLRCQGAQVARCTVERLMHAQGLQTRRWNRPGWLIHRVGELLDGDDEAAAAELFFDFRIADLGIRVKRRRSASGRALGLVEAPAARCPTAAAQREDCAGLEQPEHPPLDSDAGEVSNAVP